ncbi:MAG: NAD+ synthase [Acidimicrobiales bacterium]|nr:NAD+ synthase [Acidimicrobiales bacterium]
MSRVRLALVQTDMVVGDLDGNVDRVLASLEEVADCDLALYPEMAITGYPLEDLVHKPGFVARSCAALERVAAASGSCALIVGFADVGPDGPDGPAHNAVAVCHGGRIVGTYFKECLPTYDVFDEARDFAPGTGPLVLYRIGGVRVGLAICEDLWVPDGPVGRMVVGGADFIATVSASPYHLGKQAAREAVVAATAASSGRPVAYLNLVGSQDQLVFDGGSMVANSSGHIVARAPRFDEAVVKVDVDVEVHDDPVGDEAIRVIEVSKEIDRTDYLVVPPMDLLDETTELYAALVSATRGYVMKSGFTDVCLGLSGGVDSALVATIAADALGSDHVHAVLMPSRYSSDHSLVDAQALAVSQGIDTHLLPIEEAHTALTNLLAEGITGGPAGLVDENLQSRIRGVLLMGLSNAHGWMVLTTGNKSESAVGYSTLYGDTAGAYAVIRDLYKTRVYELCEWRNLQASGLNGQPVIPSHILSKPPSAELRPGQTDDQSLPSYDVLDPLLEAYVEGNLTRAELIADGHTSDIVDQVVRLVDAAEFKRRQTPLGPKVTTRSFGRERRMPIVNHFRG